MNGYECPCCGKFISITKAWTMKTCWHCEASPKTQNIVKQARSEAAAVGGR